MLKIISKIWGRGGSCQGCVTTLHHYSIYDFHSATAFGRSRRLLIITETLWHEKVGRSSLTEGQPCSSFTNAPGKTSVLSYIKPQKPKDHPIKYDFSCSWAKKGQWCLRKGQGSPSPSRGSILLISSFMFAAVDSQFVMIFTLHWAQFSHPSDWLPLKQEV